MGELRSKEGLGVREMQILAPAKVNLGLSILGKLPNGYHQLHTIFAALEVGDRLWL